MRASTSRQGCVRIPRASARSDARRIVGPSANRSEKWIPISSSRRSEKCLANRTAPSFFRNRNRGVPTPSQKIASDKLSQGHSGLGVPGKAEGGDDVLAARDGARLLAELGLERVDHRAELG